MLNELCPLCVSEVETVNHLLFSCRNSWALWMKFVSFWNLSLVLHDNPTAVIIAWHEVSFSFPVNSIWHLIPAAILWSIWLYRNELVFQNKRMDLPQLFFVARFHLASWFKAKNQEIAISLEDIVLSPPVVDKYSNNKLRSPLVVWKAPPVGYIKINVDGAMPVSGLRGGIGGLRRNDRGVCLGTFSKSIGFGTPVLAELLAIKVGLEAFLQAGNNSPLRVIMESDCKVAVEWVLNQGSCPACFSELVKSIDTVLSCFCVTIRHIPRECNREADALEKKG
ncbi:uncharacterized protein LOC120145963 [Hibiscus syriacus]|uniref:uncharacterized protein LOC120145963 n=1 Tax=Hibiscus syriacus TaxID=106335 RepID=UPI00192164A2|nr:uncharacterized protein LOC120145963 [Hibiscus syriacus]